MRSIILAGGKGTRLRPLTVYTPKPIVPLLNRPFLLYQIEILRRARINEITLSLNYQPNKIEHLLGYGLEHGVNLRYVTEPSPMGTGGAFKYASEDIRETTVVFNGDILTDLDIFSVIKFHQQKQAKATIVLTPVENPAAYGLVETDPEGRVKKFLEKPKPDQLDKLTTNNINAGIYVLEPEVLDLIPEGENYSFEYNVFPALLEKKMDFYAFIIENNYWRDIGTTDSYLQAHHDFLAGRIKGFELERPNSSDIATAAAIDARSVIGEGCIIKPNARIINSVIGERVHLEEKVLVENSVIWPHTRVNFGAEIKNAIVGKGCYIGRNTLVGGGAVLGDKTSLTDYTKVL
ncbi:MAG: NDP-sugar synthase [Pyrinomonadaceae bacterium]